MVDKGEEDGHLTYAIQLHMHFKGINCMWKLFVLWKMKTQTIPATGERDIKDMILLSATHTRSFSRLYFSYKWKVENQTTDITCRHGNIVQTSPKWNLKFWHLVSSHKNSSIALQKFYFRVLFPCLSKSLGNCLTCYIAL